MDGAPTSAGAQTWTGRCLSDASEQCFAGSLDRPPGRGPVPRHEVREQLPWPALSRLSGLSVVPRLGTRYGW